MVVSLIFSLNANMSKQDTTLLDFYEAPLVCNAAPSIGCGSRSKPVLLDLERDKLVVEAWLNRSGTVIAVIWNETAKDDDKIAFIDSTFQRHELDATKVNDAERRSQLLEHFGEEGVWYRGRQVDQLSREEAGIVAERVAGMIENYHPLESGLRAKVVASVKTVFEKWYTDDHLAERMHGEDSEQANLEMQQELVVACGELLGEDVVTEIMGQMGR